MGIRIILVDPAKETTQQAKGILSVKNLLYYGQKNQILNYLLKEIP